jgi:hypothetical protein
VPAQIYPLKILILNRNNAAGWRHSPAFLFGRLI